MSDRHTTPADARPEDMFDLWLDALNDPGRGGPPEPPDEIADAALIARRYHDALGMTHLAPPQRVVTERNGSMAENLTGTIPVSTRRTPPSARPNHHRFVPEWLSGGLTTAVMIGLVLLLAGGGLVRQYGWPSLSDGAPDRINLLAPGTSTPDDGALTCGSPEYRPIVEGDVNEETLSALGITEVPLQVDGDTIRIPTSSGEIVELPSTWTPLLGGPLWSDEPVPAQSAMTGTHEVTVRNIETGDEWTYTELGGMFAGAWYHDPYLFIPASASSIDWRIINTRTGDERLASAIRGEPFPVRMNIWRIDRHISLRDDPSGTSVVLFSPWPPEGTGIPHGANVLLLPESLKDAQFIPESAAATYGQDTAYSQETGQVAFATDDATRRGIAILDPETGDVLVVQDRRFADDVLPLMFSEDGSTLIVDQPGALFSISLGDDGSVSVDAVHGNPMSESNPIFVPVAFNAQTMTALIMFEDRHIALLDTRSGEINDMPGIIVPESNLFPNQPMFRVPYETQVYDLFDDTTGTVRFVNLETGSVSDEVAVFNQEADMIAAPIQPGYQMEVRYPFVAWTDAYGYLDETGTFHAVSILTDDELWSIPRPDDLSVESDQVVNLTMTPGERCLVMNVIDAVGEHDYSGQKKPDRVTTWIAPIEPGAEWTLLDIAITGWWEVYEAPEGIILPAPEVMTPLTTPQ